MDSKIVNSKKIYIIIGSMILVFLTAFNIYIYMNNEQLKKSEEEKHIKEIQLYKDKLTKKDEQISQFNKVETDEYIESDENYAVNSINHFIEYIYDMNKDSYVIRKKEAIKYMSEEMVERFFPANNVIEDNIKTEISELQVYRKVEGAEKKEGVINMIAVFNLDYSIVENDYSEATKIYMLITVKEIEGKFVVTKVEEFNTEGNYDYE